MVPIRKLISSVFLQISYIANIVKDPPINMYIKEYIIQTVESFVVNIYDFLDVTNHLAVKHVSHNVCTWVPRNDM